MQRFAAAGLSEQVAEARAGRDASLARLIVIKALTRYYPRYYPAIDNETRRERCPRPSRR